MRSVYNVHDDRIGSYHETNELENVNREVEMERKTNPKVCHQLDDLLVLNHLLKTIFDPLRSVIICTEREREREIMIVRLYMHRCSGPVDTSPD